MELYRKDPVVTKAMALALMRQALDLLAVLDEAAAGCHLQMAIDRLVPNVAPRPAERTPKCPPES